MEKFKPLFVLSISLLMATSFSSCSKDDNSADRIRYIKNPDKLEMINSIKNLDGEGRLYEMNYTVDYKLDDVLNSQITRPDQLFQYIASILYDELPTKSASVSYGAGCSAFAVPERDRINYIMGRNYDFRHFTEDKKSYLPTSAILVHTAPKNGKKSISMVDGLNLNYGQGFFENENSDLSLLMGVPYAALDGINEDGFAIGVLALTEEQTNQQQAGKPRIGTTVAIRLLLDRASTVKQAVEMLKGYNMDMRGSGNSNYHYFMADATGDFAIVEYTLEEGKTEPTVMEVFTGNDTLRCVTNFYVSPTMVGRPDGWGSNHGRARYETLRNTLKDKNYSLNADDGMQLLKAVSQPPTEELTSQTQWSSLYNLTERSLRLAILREYGREYNFKIE